MAQPRQGENEQRRSFQELHERGEDSGVKARCPWRAVATSALMALFLCHPSAASHRQEPASSTQGASRRMARPRSEPATPHGPEGFDNGQGTRPQDLADQRARGSRNTTLCSTHRLRRNECGRLATHAADRPADSGEGVFPPCAMMRIPATKPWLLQPPCVEQARASLAGMAFMVSYFWFDHKFAHAATAPCLHMRPLSLSLSLASTLLSKNNACASVPCGVVRY